MFKKFKLANKFEELFNKGYVFNDEEVKQLLRYFKCNHYDDLHILKIKNKFYYIQRNSNNIKVLDI